MSVKSLSNISSQATERTNTTGEMTPILEINPDRGTVIALLNNAVERGEQATGVPVFADLKSGAATDLPADTRMQIEFEGPNDQTRRAVSEAKENIRAYRALTVTQQQNEEYIDRVKHVLKGEAVRVEDVDTLYVSVEASAQISWSDSQLTFDETAVRER